MAYSPQIQGLDKTGGSAGAAGVTGPTGPTGITGPTGPTGSGGGSSIWTYTSGTMAAGKMKTSNAVVSSTVTISLSVQAKVAGPAWNNFFNNYVTYGISFILLLVDSAGKTFVFGVSSVTNTGTAGTENYAIGLISLLVDGTSWSGDYSIFFVPKPFDPASPGPIGGTTPAAGAFTTLSASGPITVTSGTISGVPITQVIVTTDRTTVLSDGGNSIFHPASDNNARTQTINSNANVAYPVGTIIEFVNMAAASETIAITADTLYLLPALTTGSRTLAQGGRANAEKISATEWIISGNSALT